MNQQFRTFLGAAASTARHAALGTAKFALWITAPVITSVRGAWDRADVRAVLTRVLVTAGLSWQGIKIAAHNPEFVGAFVVVILGVLQGIHTAVERKVNGAPPLVPGPAPVRPANGVATTTTATTQATTPVPPPTPIQTQPPTPTAPTAT